MSTAQSLIDDVRARIVEASADFFTDAQILRWLNQGYRNFALQTYMLEKTIGYTIVANQYEYDLPTDCLAIQDIRWAEDNSKVDWRDQEEFSQIGGTMEGTSDKPRYYTMHPSAPTGKIRLYEIPNTASDATTLNGGINSSVATIVLTDASAFPTRGRILIGTEQILYFNKSGNSLLQCVRGDGFTTAASASTLAAVTHLPLTVAFAYSPPAMVVSSVDCRLPLWYDEAIINYASAICFRGKDKYETADRCMKVYKDLMEKAMGEVVKAQRDRLPCIKDDWMGE